MTTVKVYSDLYNCEDWAPHTKGLMGYINKLKSAYFDVSGIKVDEYGAIYFEYSPKSVEELLSMSDIIGQAVIIDAGELGIYDDYRE